MKDFPAAHSNDTEWFGIDDDGNVAMFYTGADGAAPIGQGSETLPDSWFDIAHEEKILIFNCDFLIEEYPELLEEPSEFQSAVESGMYDDLVEIEGIDQEHGDNLEDKNIFIADYKEYEHDIYLFLITDEEIIPKLAPGVAAFYFPKISGSEYGLVVTPVTLTRGFSGVINQLIQSGKIKGFAGVDPTIYDFDFFCNIPVFRFGTEDCGFTHPYVKEDIPKRVLNSNDISGGFPFSHEKMNCRFNEMHRIQLMEMGYTEDDLCLWSSLGWVALDGKVYDYEGNFLGMKKDM